MNNDMLSSGKCALCGSERLTVDGFPEISSAVRKLINHDYRVIKCLTCRFYFVLPPISLTRNQWQELYGDGYFGKETAWWIKKRARDRQQRLDWLEKYKVTPICNFLDIGCGEGYVLIDTAKRGWNASGIDICDNRIKAAKEINISFTQGDLLEFHFPDSHYDCIYLDSVLEHLLKPLDYLKEINRILRPGGVVYIGVPNEDCLFNKFKKLVLILRGKSEISAHTRPFKPPYHVIGFEAKSLAKAVVGCGFEIVKMRNFSGEFEWRKFRAFSRPFLMHLTLLPIHLAAIPLKKRIYLDAVIRKKER